MTHVVLRPDGKVILVGYDKSESDVSDNAGEYLFHLAMLDEGLLLRDIFLVLQRNPLLLQVFRRLHAEYLVQEVLSDGAPLPPDYGPKEIEYLELTWFCMADHDTRTYESQFLTLSGVGFSLREALETEQQVLPVGYRQLWSLSMSPVRELANYSVRFKAEVEIGRRSRDETNASEHPTLSGKVSFGMPTFGQVIHGVLHELTFFGVGEAREEFQELISEEQIAGEWQEVSADDLLAQLDEMIRNAKGH